MRSGQIRESCSGCNNAGCRSFSCGGRPKAESAQGSLEKKAALAAVRSVLQLSGQDGSTRWRSLQLTALAAVRFSVRIGLCLFGKKGNARWRSLLRLRLCLKPCPNLRFGAQASCESSPASVGSELTAPFCQADRRWLFGQDGNTRCVRSSSAESNGRRGLTSDTCSFQQLAVSGRLLTGGGL